MANFAFCVCRRDREMFERLLVTIASLDDVNHNIYIYCVDNSRSITSSNNLMLQRIKDDGLEIDYYLFMHEDIVILNSNLLNDIIHFLSLGENFGAMGVAGVKFMPKSQVFWEGECYGDILEDRGPGVSRIKFRDPNGDQEFETVDMVDGLAIVSKLNIPWNEKVDGFHFYDVSYCRDIRDLGYKTIIPKQVEPWFIHASGYRAWDQCKFDDARNKYKELYGV